MAEKLMLIDGNSLLFRAFYALPLLHNSEGIFTNGVYGFLTMLNRVIDEEKPSHIVVAFDKDKHTFRKEMYENYKANRSAPPDELKGQFQLIRDILDALNITYIEVQGYEADDIIGTLSRKAEESGLDTVIVTGDGDALQLVSDKVTVMMNKKGISEIEMYDPAGVLAKWEVEPEKLIEIKALMGDSSDNIPGVPGVGAKTAVKLIKEYGSLENLYEHLGEVKGKKLTEKLEENRDQAFLSRQLATIERNMDIELEWERFKVKNPERDRLIELYKRLEFNNFLNNLAENEKKSIEVSGQDIEVIEINSEQDAALLLEKAKSANTIAVQAKTDYHHPMWARLTGLFFAVEDNVYHLSVSEQSGYMLDWVRPVLESDSISKLMHNAKFIEVLLLRYGIKLRGIAGDTLLLAYVNDPVFEGDDLSAVILKYLNMNIASDRMELQVSKIKELYDFIYSNTPEELRQLFNTVEMPLSSVLAQMEFAGVRVDKETLVSIADELAAGINHNENCIFELAGDKFNINSPKQLGKVLFEDLGLRVIKKTKTGYATGVEVLEELYDEHEIIPYILNYRQLTKLKSTYVDALTELIHPDTGKVHTIFKQAQTATGRLSSVEPNLQNIPVRMEEGRKIRKAFKASDDDCLIVSADYSQIDLRSLAHISEDKTLIETFAEGIDIHARTAAEIFGVPLDKVDEDLRRRAKAVNFGIIYGISDFGLARDTGVSRKEAKKYIENYLNSYPGVKQYMEDIVSFGREKGYVETILGRRRYLPDLKAKNKMVQSFARRMALNTPIQGTSADIIKLAMIKVFVELKARELKSKILLQVHDDLILEVPQSELTEVCGLLRECMENALSLKVPLEVSIKAGSNWYDMKKI